VPFLCALLTIAAAPLDWSPGMIARPGAWTLAMNGGLVHVEGGVLRVEIAAGHKWAVGAIPAVCLPANLREVAVKVRTVRGGKWFMRLYGDLYRLGKQDYDVFDGETEPGEYRISIDPRLHTGQPLCLQLGLEGDGGAVLEVEGLELIAGPAPDAARPMSIPAVDYLPRLPRPFKLLDWRHKAQAYDRFVFDLDAAADLLPLCWLDDSHINNPRTTFGLCSYVGDKRQGGHGQEGINCLGALLGATLVGIDKRAGDHDWIAMADAFVNRRNGSGLVLNGQDTGTGGSFWYDLLPHIDYYALFDRYPDTPGMAEVVRHTADRWADVCRALGGSETAAPNFDHTGFDLRTMKPHDGEWREPDAAAGIAWLEFAAWHRFHDKAHLQAAEWGLRFLDERRANPYYECLLPWGTVTCARMNAELGRHHDLDKLLSWCFGISACRGGWGVTLNRWGDYDCGGLLGSVDNRGGYAFAMNTFLQAGALAPVARYEPRHARALGRWLLNLANAARLFYPGQLPPGHEENADWHGDPGHVIAYEGLRAKWHGVSPCATGDPVAMHWGPSTDLGLYGSSYVGFLGALVGRTEVEAMPTFDLLATDFFRDPAYATRLVYNPYDAPRAVTLMLGEGTKDLYDAVTHRFVLRGATGAAPVTVPPDEAMVLVETPAGGHETRLGAKLSLDGVVIDYHADGR
jgi:hypothetical protein